MRKALHASPRRSARSVRRALTISTVAALLVQLAPTTSLSFFQQTRLEGAIGADIGGVWLAIHQVMPEFRITYPKPAEGRPVPFKVGPIPSSLEPLVGQKPEGASVTELTDKKVCEDLGIFLGDIIIKVNATDTPDPESFERSLEALPPTVLLAIRRPTIMLTSARILKIKYEATPASDQGASAMAAEKINIEVLESVVPFNDKLEETRKTHEIWQPAASDIEGVKTTWFELPTRSPAYFNKGSHRVVSAGNFDEALTSDKGLKSSKLAVVMELEGNPLKGAGKSIDLYGIETMDKDTMTGTYVTATIATAPFPINIEFKGRFRMTRLADWSEKDVEARASKAPAKPKEDLNSYKLAPDVPAPPAPAPKQP